MRHPVLVRGLLAALACAVVLGCQTGPKVETVVKEEPGSVLVVQTTQAKATVTAIDAVNRTITLKRGRRDPKVFKLGEQAVNHQQVRVGDGAEDGVDVHGHPGRRLRRRPDGACTFLDRDGLCLVHKRLGEAAKPRVCRQFPFVFVAAPGGERVPRPHGRHCFGSSARMMGRKYPASHGVHPTDPSFSAYEPVRQSRHSSMPSVGANVPFGHGRDASLELAPTSGRYVPLGVGEHRSAPTSSEYVPTGHGAHTAAPGAAANVPRGDVGHGRQFSTQLDPVNGRYEPAGHGTHSVWPSSST